MPMIGEFNIFGFDLPFLFRRSWKHRIGECRSACGAGPVWGDNVIDLGRTVLAAWRSAGAGVAGVLWRNTWGWAPRTGDGKAFAELWRRATGSRRKPTCGTTWGLTAKVAEALGVII